MSIAQTKKLKYKHSTQLKQKQSKLKALRSLIQAGQASLSQITEADRIDIEVKSKAREEYTLHQTLEKEAYNMGKAHDRCTTEFFRPWKDTHAAQHIERMKEADWSDPSNPRFTGRIVTGSKAILEQLKKFYTALYILAEGTR